ncbi:hypothetical protein INR49_032602, partial [Caranx melampygus]
MVVDDIHFMNILRGKRIKLTLKTSSYIGVVQRINYNKTLILTDVVSSSNGYKFPGSKLFFGHEIINVEFTSDGNNESGATHDHTLEDHLTVETFQPYRKTITMGGDEDDEYINFIVIDEFHEKFGPAVMHIKKLSVIGVGTEGVDSFQHGRLCWLKIATKNKVYLFDILLLGIRAFRNGLTMILENKQILKVIHDCRAVSGCLFGQFGVKLTNVFDSQVADVMCFYQETGGFLPDRVSALEEVVSHHLKVPSSQLLSLKMKSQLTKEMWYKRPCPVALLKVMVLSVIHLQPLRLVLLDALMTDYMALVDSYLDSSQYEPGDLENVTMESALELPRELRQLQQMHHERQEWAAHHYPITEEGLLDRFNPRPKSPSQTSPTAEDTQDTLMQTAPHEPANVQSPSSAQPVPPLSQSSTSAPELKSVSSAGAMWTLRRATAQPPLPGSSEVGAWDQNKPWTQQQGVAAACVRMHTTAQAFCSARSKRTPDSPGLLAPIVTAPIT